MRAVVTGGAGFIGSHVTARLIAEGWPTLVLDDLSAGGGLTRCRPKQSSRRWTSESPGAVTAIERFRPDLIVHCAAQISVARSMSDPAADWRINVVGTERVLEAARSTGARVVFLSSGGAIYGETEGSSELALPRPEELLRSAQVRGGAVPRAVGPVVRDRSARQRLRPWAAAGSGRRRRCDLRRGPRGPGHRSRSTAPGDQPRDFVHVGDVVDALSGGRDGASQ